MTALSEEQLAVVNAPLVPLAVVACAGSGKTRTAVRRLAEVRNRLGASRAYPTLLSFSNVAVDTFRSDYADLVKTYSGVSSKHRVCIETADSFITGSILRPHAYRTMGSTRTPYLVNGNEPFLEQYRFRPDKFPLPISKMKIGVRHKKPYFYCEYYENVRELEYGYAKSFVDRLGKLGAYTHDLGRYWALETLIQQPEVLKTLAWRHPHILVDEAQDIGTVHQAILELLIEAGAQVSLIGDPNQAIYKFAGADGSFLAEYPLREGVGSHSLSTNYRSAPVILAVANAISKRKDIPIRSAPETKHGAYFIAYSQAERRALVDTFHVAVEAAGLDHNRSAIICRAKDIANQLRGTDAAHGEGLVKDFVIAALWRDARANFYEAFKAAARGVVPLLVNAPDQTLSLLERPASHPEVKHLRRLIWSFVRNPATGLPPASLNGDSQWHPALVKSIKGLLADIYATCGYEVSLSPAMKLRNRKLPEGPFMEANLVAHGSRVIRIETVHQVKGESLDAVLYIANKANVQALIDGVGTEDGRIGYVAVTRARDLFWLAVPDNCIHGLRDKLLALGFKEAKS